MLKGAGLVSVFLCVGACHPGSSGSGAQPRQEAAEADHSRCLELTKQLVGDSDETRRGAAAQALGGLWSDPECAVQALIGAVREDAGTYVPDEALRALGELGPLAVSAVDDLMLLERPDDSPVDPDRLTDTLIRIGPGGIPRLVYHLRMDGPSADEDTIGTWGLASAVLRELGTDAVPGLIDCLSDPARKGPAMTTLRALGPAAASAAPALVKLYRQDESMRWGALQALYSIGEAACVARDLIEEILRAGDTSAADRRDAERALESLAECPVEGKAQPGE